MHSPIYPIGGQVNHPKAWHSLAGSADKRIMVYLYLCIQCYCVSVFVIYSDCIHRNGNGNESNGCENTINTMLCGHFMLCFNYSLNYNIANSCRFSLYTSIQCTIDPAVGSEC